MTERPGGARSDSEVRPVLAGVRVLELSAGVAGALAGHLLHGYGADVHHVEPPSRAPLTADQRRFLHHGKATARLPSRTSQSADWWAGWWAGWWSGVDIVVSDRQPHELRALGIDWSVVRRDHPNLIVVSVTSFGLTGPYADHLATDAVSFASGGIMSLTGHPDRHPLVTGGDQAGKLAGLNAFAAATVCLHGRARHGLGELVDLSAQECAAAMLEMYAASTAVGGPVVPRLGNHTRAVWAIYPCLDGWAGVFALERQVPALFAMLDDPELDEPRFRDPLQRVVPENEEALTVKLYVWFIDKTVDEVLAAGAAAKVPIGVARTPAELVTSAGLVERGAFDTITAASAGGDGAGAPAATGGAEAAAVIVPGRPFGGFGWDVAHAYESIAGPGSPPGRGRTTGRSDAHRHQADGARLPLHGLRVVDLTMMWAGPFATLQMASMGANVIKVESPAAWDNIRTLILQPGVADPWNSSYYFQAYNRDKRSLTLDLRQAAGRDLLLRVLATADVLIENYRADVLDSLGLGDDVLFAANPRLVVVSMAAFGRTGADRNLVGFGPVIELMSGLVSLTGYAGEDEPFKTGLSYCDPVAGLYAVAAVALGLRQRNAGGVGCHVDLAQREGAMVLAGEAFVDPHVAAAPPHTGCRDARFVPQGVYRAASPEPDLGPAEWIVVSVRDDADWAALCSVIGRDDLARIGIADRARCHDALDTAIEAWTIATSPQDAVEMLQAHGIPAGHVLDTGSVLDDIHLLRRGHWVHLPNPKMRRHKQAGAIWRLSATKPIVRRHAPFFGEHTAEILAELGVTPDELAALTRDGVTGTAPVNPGVG